MNPSNLAPTPEMYCPECRAMLASDLRERLFRGETVYCEMCGTKFPEVNLAHVKAQDIIQKEKTKTPQRNVFKEEIQKQKDYLLGWANVFKDEWQKQKKTQQEKFQQRKEHIKTRWQERKRRVQSRWKKWKEKWQARREAKKQARLQQQPLPAVQNIFLTPANFDPLTGKRVEPQPMVSNRPVFRFNPRTGQALPGPNNVIFRFDPLTGKRLHQAQNQPPSNISSDLTSIPNTSPVSTHSLANEPVKPPQIVDSTPVQTAIPDPRKMAFDPITGEPILEGYIKDRIFTVLDTIIRDRLLHLNVGEEDRSVLAQAMVFLTVEQQSKYLTELERANNPNLSNDQALIQALRALPIPESDKESLINQLSYIPEEKHPEFVAQMVNLQPKPSESDKNLTKPFSSNILTSEIQIPPQDIKDPSEKPKEKKKTREREFA